MWTTDSEIRTNAEKLKVEFSLLSAQEAKGVIDRTIQTFCTEGSWEGARLFERFRDSLSMRGSDVWEKIADFVGEQPVFVFAEPSESQNVYRFESGTEFTRVHGECANFTAYIIPVTSDFVLASTNEDSLVGTGQFAQTGIWEYGEPMS